MRTMSGGPCLHYDCTNRNSFGYCRTSVCINEHYMNEQVGRTSNCSESVTVNSQNGEFNKTDGFLYESIKNEGGER